MQRPGGPVGAGNKNGNGMRDTGRVVGDKGERQNGWRGIMYSEEKVD